MGKIDLSALNQSTRPKKRGKDDRRRGGDKTVRVALPKRKATLQMPTARNANVSARRRSTSRKLPHNPDSAPNAARKAETKGSRDKDSKIPQNERKRGDRGKGDSKPRRNNDRAPKQESNPEDVQKQVKETLARLTNKAPKKGVKWRKEKKEAIHNRELENQRREEAESRVIQLTEFVTANDLANLMEVPVNNVIATCMNLGVMVSINQRLDAETINIVAEEFGFTTEYVSASVTEAITPEEDDDEDLIPRPPIVTVMQLRRPWQDLAARLYP